ncbi:MAG: hypothetical protein ACXWWB_09205 [Nitrospira sp.]
MILRILWSRSKKGNASSCLCVQAHVLLVKGYATHRTRMPGLFMASDAPVRFVRVSETFTEAPALPVVRRDIALPIDHLRQ